APLDRERAIRVEIRRQRIGPQRRHAMLLRDDADAGEVGDLVVAGERRRDQRHRDFLQDVSDQQHDQEGAQAARRPTVAHALADTTRGTRLTSWYSRSALTRSRSWCSPRMFLAASRPVSIEWSVLL